MRILHVLGKLDRGGVETWLVQMLAHVDRSKYAMDFLVHTDKPGAYDDEVRRLGAMVIPCLAPHRPLVYARNFLRILKENGPYDVVHSHVHHFSGYVLALAKLAGVTVRIAHSHTDIRAKEQTHSLPRKAYCAVMKTMVKYCATGGLAVSSDSGDSLFPPGWLKTERWKLSYLGIDLSRFSAPVDSFPLRRQLGLERASVVVGHVGRVDADKNQKFIVEIASELVKLDPEAMFLLVGGGPLVDELKQNIRDKGLSRHFVLAGIRGDVPQLMLGAMDVFLFPSIREGLPITLLEAQAAGLRCLASDRVTIEADMIPELVARESLQSPAHEWAQAVVRHASLPRLASEMTRPRMGPRSIPASCKELINTYESFASS